MTRYAIKFTSPTRKDAYLVRDGGKLRTSQFRDNLATYTSPARAHAAAMRYWQSTGRHVVASSDTETFAIAD